MSPTAWKFFDDNIIWVLLFGGGFGAWLFKMANRVLLALDRPEVKLARIEADKQVRIAQAQNQYNEEEDDE